MKRRRNWLSGHTFIKQTINYKGHLPRNQVIIIKTINKHCFNKVCSNAKIFIILLVFSNKALCLVEAKLHNLKLTCRSRVQSKAVAYLFSSIFCRFLAFSSSVRMYSFLMPISKHFFNRHLLQKRRFDTSILHFSS